MDEYCNQKSWEDAEIFPASVKNFSPNFWCLTIWLYFFSRGPRTFLFCSCSSLKYSDRCIMNADFCLTFVSSPHVSKFLSIVHERGYFVPVNFFFFRVNSFLFHPLNWGQHWLSEPNYLEVVSSISESDSTKVHILYFSEQTNDQITRMS